MFPHLRLGPGLRPQLHPEVPRHHARAGRIRANRWRPPGTSPKSAAHPRPRLSGQILTGEPAGEGDDADMTAYRDAYREFTGKTVEEALKGARDEFGVGLDELDFEILTPGSRGVLGMGAEPARVLAAPRSLLGGSTPKREAAAQVPLPAPAARARRSPATIATSAMTATATAAPDLPGARIAPAAGHFDRPRPASGFGGAAPAAGGFAGPRPERGTVDRGPRPAGPRPDRGPGGRPRSRPSGRWPRPRPAPRRSPARPAGRSDRQGARRSRGRPRELRIRNAPSPPRSRPRPWPRPRRSSSS